MIETRAGARKGPKEKTCCFFRLVRFFVFRLDGARTAAESGLVGPGDGRSRGSMGSLASGGHGVPNVQWQHSAAGPGWFFPAMFSVRMVEAARR